MIVKVKKKNAKSIYFVILLTFIFLVSCKSNQYYNYEIKTSKINVNDKSNPDSKIESYINQYKIHIEKDLDSVLSYCPETLDKSIGKWETNIGLFLAKTTFDLGNPVFEKRTKKSIDFVLLNHGGIRSTIPKGDVTTRTAFNVMPFENSLIIVGLKGFQIKDLANHILKENKPHPMYGIKIFSYKDSRTLHKVEINNELLDESKTYYVATSDYLANGGDNMIFFKESSEKYDIDYKLRNLLIDYFKKNKTIELNSNKIVIEE